MYKKGDRIRMIRGYPSRGLPEGSEWVIGKHHPVKEKVWYFKGNDNPVHENHFVMVQPASDDEWQLVEVVEEKPTADAIWEALQSAAKGL